MERPMTDERGKKMNKNKKGSAAGTSKDEVDPCAEYQADGVPCPEPEQSCDECGRGTPRKNDAG